MALVERLLGWGHRQPSANVWTNPMWWTGSGDSVAGVTVGADTALKISAVFACVGLLSETIASLPLIIYRYLEDEQGRARARNHPLYALLHDQPNQNQTAIEFVQMMQTHALLRGSGYAEIVPGARGFVDQLLPIHPDYVTKEKLATGRLRYRVRDEITGQERVLNNEDIFEVGGLTLDGWNTVSVVSYARDSFGLSLAAERYGSRFFRNGSRPGGVLQTDGKLSRDAAMRIKGDWEAFHSGENQHRVAVLEQGLKWQQVSITPEDAQFLETREYQAEDVCRWFRVPPHMVGLTSKATSWGSGIEQMSIGFVSYTLRPWLTRWTQAIKRDLILAPQTYFADFVVEHLLRGDISTRYNAYAIGRQWGWLSTNEIRGYENLNPIPGGDNYLTPMNMSTGDEPAAGDHYRQLAEESAARLVRKEIAAITRLSQGDDFANQVTRFYEGHASLVAQAMRISLDRARVFCNFGRDLVIEHDVQALVNWETRRVIDLADLATGNGDARSDQGA